jgi:hypothetical protein
MKLNVPAQPLRTHEGGIAKQITPLQALKRTVMSCLLWESNAYEDGESVSERLRRLVGLNKPADVAGVAVEARTQGKLRHVPLLLVREMARLPEHKALVASTLEDVIQRPDELSEFLAIYWKEGKQPLSAQVKKGLANAFGKFDEYSLAKYNRDGAVKLRDVLFLCHAKPGDAEQEALWRRLMNNELAITDTWEVELSAGAGDKLASWTRLLTENKLGALALLRNIRNMQNAGVDKSAIEEALRNMKVERVLPFRFIAAARYAPHLEPVLEDAMLRCLKGQSPLKGKTLLLVDVSGSMDHALSGKSDMRAIDAACALAILTREICEETEVMSFSTDLVDVPLRRGFALRDAIVKSQRHGGTNMAGAITVANRVKKYDRIIVFTDEQSDSRNVPDPEAGLAYMINVASCQNGVGYGKWRHIDGFSENILTYIQASESGE